MGIYIPGSAVPVTLIRKRRSEAAHRLRWMKRGSCAIVKPEMMKKKAKVTEMRKPKYGWNVLGIMGLVFLPIGLVYMLLGAGLWYFGVGDKPEVPVIFLGVFGGTGCIFAVLGLIFLSGDVRRRRIQKRLFESGYSVKATVTDARRVPQVRVNHRNPVVLECRYAEPGTGNMHTWRSRYLYTDEDIQQFLGREVPVYVDRWDIKEGFVDVDAISPEIKGYGERR